MTNVRNLTGCCHLTQPAILELMKRGAVMDHPVSWCSCFLSLILFNSPLTLHFHLIRPSCWSFKLDSSCACHPSGCRAQVRTEATRSDSLRLQKWTGWKTEELPGAKKGLRQYLLADSRGYHRVRGRTRSFNHGQKLTRSATSDPAPPGISQPSARWWK